MRAGRCNGRRSPSFPRAVLERHIFFYNISEHADGESPHVDPKVPEETRSRRDLSDATLRLDLAPRCSPSACAEKFLKIGAPRRRALARAGAARPQRRAAHAARLVAHAARGAARVVAQPRRRARGRHGGRRVAFAAVRARTSRARRRRRHGDGRPHGRRGAAAVQLARRAARQDRGHRRRRVQRRDARRRQGAVARRPAEHAAARAGRRAGRAGGGQARGDEEGAREEGRVPHRGEVPVGERARAARGAGVAGAAPIFRNFSAHADGEHRGARSSRRVASERSR